MQKICRKYAPKPGPRPLFDFDKQPQHPMYTRNSFENKIILKEDYQKTLKKLT